MPSLARLVAIDIDGTLLPTASTEISLRNRRALCQAQAAGLHIAIATGRRHRYAKPVLEQIGLPPETILISSNGSVVRRFDGALIRRHLLPVASATALCTALRPFGETMVFTFDREGEAELIVESMAALNERVGAWVEANRDAIAEVRPLERAFADGEVPIQGMLCGGIAQVRAAQQALEASGFAGSVAMHRTEYADRDLGILDLLPPDCSKGDALAEHARSLGLAPDQVMAIGDNFNDQSMLEYAGHPVLMGNAGDELMVVARAQGWRIAGTNDQDGVAAVLEPLTEAYRAQAAGTEVESAATIVTSR